MAVPISVINCPNSPKPIELAQWTPFQHITYNEWLPLVLGASFMDELDILPLSQVRDSIPVSDWPEQTQHETLIG